MTGWISRRQEGLQAFNYWILRPRPISLCLFQKRALAGPSLPIHNCHIICISSFTYTELTTSLYHNEGLASTIPQIRS